jgi:hypothetical protein
MEQTTMTVTLPDGDTTQKEIPLLHWDEEDCIIEYDLGYAQAYTAWTEEVREVENANAKAQATYKEAYSAWEDAEDAKEWDEYGEEVNDNTDGSGGGESGGKRRRLDGHDDTGGDQSGGD